MAPFKDFLKYSLVMASPLVLLSQREAGEFKSTCLKKLDQTSYYQKKIASHKEYESPYSEDNPSPLLKKFLPTTIIELSNLDLRPPPNIMTSRKDKGKKMA